jgi:hypothetical protein
MELKENTKSQPPEKKGVQAVSKLSNLRNREQF